MPLDNTMSTTRPYSPLTSPDQIGYYSYSYMELRGARSLLKLYFRTCILCLFEYDNAGQNSLVLVNAVRVQLTLFEFSPMALLDESITYAILFSSVFSWLRYCHPGSLFHLDICYCFAAYIEDLSGPLRYNEVLMHLSISQVSGIQLDYFTLFNKVGGSRRRVILCENVS